LIGVDAESKKATVVTPMMISCRPIPFGRPKLSPNPAPIWRVPSPRETATPNKVAMIARTSIAFPIGPLARFPSRGESTALIKPGLSLRKLKYATASATTA
jgi:hypothetical protein